ncbi:MAG: HIT domain-containing protein [Chloroflexi bacterium]|nr:HIT domain-containing protein [Chloroflexota bacterium]
MSSEDCLFCRIVRREIPARVAREDEHTLAFHDTNPQAPFHVLVVPKAHVASLADAADAEALGRVLAAAAAVGREGGTGGFRVVVNSGRDAGQSVGHLHLHVLAGRPLGWPPG